MGSTDTQIQAAYADAKNAFPEECEVGMVLGGEAQAPSHHSGRKAFYMGIYEVDATRSGGR